MTERILGPEQKLNNLEYFYVGFVEMMFKNIKVHIS